MATQDILETAQIIVALMYDHPVQLDNVLPLNGHAPLVRTLVDAKDAGRNRFWDILGTALGLDPALAAEVLRHLGQREFPAIPNKRSDWYELDDLLNVERVAPIYEERGVCIPDKAITLLLGQSGKGKSFVTFDWAMRLSLKLVNTKRVVYVAAEKFGLYRDRAEAWIKHHKLKPSVGPLLYPRAVKLAGSEAVASWIQELRIVAPHVGIVFIDTLARCMNGDENSAEDMGKLVEACEHIKTELNCAVVLVHHLGKTAGKGARGHSSLDGAVDTIIELSAKDHVITLKNSKQNSMQEFPDVTYRLEEVDLGEDPQLKRKITSCVVVPMQTQEKNADKRDYLEPQQLAILRLLYDSPDGMGQTDLARAMGLNPKQKSSITYKLEWLIEKKGMVSQAAKRAPYKITDSGRAFLTEAKIVGAPAVQCSARSETPISEQN